MENSFEYILQRQNGVWGAEGRGLFFPEYFAKHTILKKYVELFSQLETEQRVNPDFTIDF